MKNLAKKMFGITRGNNRSKNERGLTVMEYAVAAAALIGVAYFAMSNMGSALNQNLTQTGDFLRSKNINTPQS